MINKEEANHINQLVESIERRKAHNKESRSTTYEDVPALKEIKEILENHLEEDKNTLITAYDGYVYLADAYTSLTRFSICAEYHLKALQIAIKLLEKYDYKVNGAKDVYYALLRDRNFFVDDDCEDVLKLVNGYHLLSKEVIKDVYEARMKRRRGLKNDPVEMSKEYLAVIDEVEEKIEKNRTLRGMGSCFEVWELKEKYLAEKGITWQSPFMLNPGVMFD